MKVEKLHIDLIKSAFEKMQSREDFLALLNLAKPMVYGEKAVPFELKQLTWHTNPKLGRKRYFEFQIKKKSGASRNIHAPIKGLKAIQKTLSFILQCVYEPHKAAMGFVRNKSIVDNAKLHIGNIYVYNIDLKDFFPSIDQARVWKCLQLKPFNLINQNTSLPQLLPEESNISKKINLPNIETLNSNELDTIGNEIGIFLAANTWKTKKPYVKNRLYLANMIASLCCTEMEVERKNKSGEWEIVNQNVVPQGAPTSPVITNIVCQKLDFLLSGVAKRFGLRYSRYADDITFSSMHNVFQPESDFIKELHRIIAQQNFHIKESKTRLQKDGYRKEVTGLLVNEQVNVQKRYIKQLRMWLYYWETYGYEKAYNFFLQQYRSEKGHVKKGKPDMANVIGGKLDFLRMVKGADNEMYLKLKGRFDELMGEIYKTTNIENRREHLNEILTSIIKEGIGNAMSKYKKQ